MPRPYALDNLPNASRPPFEPVTKVNNTSSSLSASRRIRRSVRLQGSFGTPAPVGFPNRFVGVAKLLRVGKGTRRLRHDERFLAFADKAALPASHNSGMLATKIPPLGTVHLSSPGSTYLSERSAIACETAPSRLAFYSHTETAAASRVTKAFPFHVSFYVWFCLRAGAVAAVLAHLHAILGAKLNMLLD